MLLQDKVVIVTGAARGIGKVYARGIAEAGGKVAVSDILDGEETVEEIRKAGGGRWVQAGFLTHGRPKL